MLQDNIERFSEQYGFLKRVLEVEGFRLIFLETNAEQVISKALKKELKKDYPQRNITYITIQNKSYKEIVESIYSAQKGFVFITDFYTALPREDIIVGFNQRRDKFAEFPIALFLFLRRGDVPLCVQKMPDLWSYRSYIMDLKYIPEIKDFSMNKLNIEMLDLIELERLPVEEAQKSEQKIKEIEAKLSIFKENIQDDFQRTIILPELIRHYENLSDYSKALEHTLRLKEIYSKSSKKNAELDYKIELFTALQSFYNKDFDKSKELLERIANNSLYTPDYRVYYYLGLSVLKECIDGNQLHSLDYLAKSISLKNDNPKVYIMRAFIYIAKEDYDRAIEDYSKAIELNPNKADYYEQRGDAYSNKGDYDSAIQDYSKAIELKPNKADYYNNRGWAYSDKGDYDRAIEDYSKAIELKPDEAICYNNRGMAYSDKGYYDRAIQDYSKAIELNPNKADYYNNRGIAYRYKGDYDSAIEDYSKAIQLKPDEANYYNNRGFAYYYKGDYDRTIEDFTKVIELKPDKVDYYNNRARAYRYKGDYDSAIEDFTKTIQLKPDEAEYYFSRGLTYYYQRDYDRAIEDYSKAIQLNPDEPNTLSTLSNLSQLLFIVGNFAKAIECWQQAIHLESKQTDLLAELWFYAYAHIPEKQNEAEAILTELIQQSNGKPLSKGWNLDANIERAINSNHPNSSKLKEFAKAITG